MLGKLVVLLGILVLSVFPAEAADGAASETPVSTTITLRVSDVAVDRYDRSRFGGYEDADGNCRNTMNEILARESRVPVLKDCAIAKGEWQDPLSGTIMKTQGEVAITPLVPFVEAWASGAYLWTPERRFSYTNHLGNRYHLLTLSPSTVGSRGDRSPEAWLPKYNACWYATTWVIVKSEWDLTVDEQEGRFLRKKLKECKSSVVLEFDGMPGEEKEVGPEKTKTFETEDIDPKANCCVICEEPNRACGDVCTAPGKICMEAPGCACDSWQVNGFDKLF